MRKVAVIDDSGFAYTMTEITTAVRRDLPVVAVVLDDGACRERCLAREYRRAETNEKEDAEYSLIHALILG